jgi:hypothetical protein
VFLCVCLCIHRNSWNPEYWSQKSKSHYDPRLIGQSVLVSSPIWDPKPHVYYYQTFSVLSMSVGLKFTEREIWGQFSWVSWRVKRLFVLMCWSILFFRSSVMRNGRPDRSSSWTFVLPSLNIRHHFLTFDSVITLSPYTAISWMSDGHFVHSETELLLALHTRRNYRFSYPDRKSWSPRLGVGAVGRLPTHHKNI